MCCKEALAYCRGDLQRVLQASQLCGLGRPTGRERTPAYSPSGMLCFQLILQGPNLYQLCNETCGRRLTPQWASHGHSAIKSSMTTCVCLASVVAPKIASGRKTCLRLHTHRCAEEAVQARAGMRTVQPCPDWISIHQCFCQCVLFKARQVVNPKCDSM